MLFGTLAPYERLVSETAAEYREQGYLTQENPPSKDLPEFLRKFHPDIIARSPDDRFLFVEVKTKEKVRRIDHWRELRDAIAQLPEWELRLVVNNQREDELITASKPLYAWEEIEATLRAGERLSRQKVWNAAFVTAWVALEAILRRQAQAENIPLQDEAPGTLITTLTSNGSLNYEDYGLLMSLLPQRNQAVYGHQPDDLEDTAKKTLKVARRLLKQFDRGRQEKAA